MSRYYAYCVSANVNPKKPRSFADRKFSEVAMISIIGPPNRVCDRIRRREILRAAGAGLLGLSLPKILAAESDTTQRIRTAARAKSVIFLFLFGGPSQLETFDLKPDAPSKIRGPFKPIASRTPGLLISEHLDRLAAVSDKFCVVR